MKQKPFGTRFNIPTIATGVVLAGAIFVFACAVTTFAFNGPSQNPPSGSGAIGSDASNDVGIGTSTISGTKLVVVGASSDTSTNAVQFLESNGSPIFILRDDDSVSIGTSTISAGNTVLGGGLTIGGSFTANQLVGNLSAPLVTSGEFAGGNYEFPSNVGIGTTTPANLLDVDGNADVQGHLSVGTTTTSTAKIITSGGGIGISLAGNVITPGANVGLQIYNNGSQDYIYFQGGGGVYDQLGYSGTNFLFTAGSSSEPFDFTGANVGIGTTNPLYALDLGTGLSYGLNGVPVIQASTTLPNYFFGDAGNLTATGTRNIGTGYLALHSLTTGGGNTANGYESLYSNTTGNYNAANGYATLYPNTTGGNNIANGYESLYSNTTGGNNTANGFESLYANTTGGGNTANGFDSLYTNTTGGNNTALGDQSGRYISGGSVANVTSTNSTYLGVNAYPLASGDTNETVIGYGAVGSGSNTVNLGGTGTTGTIIPYGSVGIGTTNPTTALTVVGNVSSTGICLSGVCNTSWPAGGSYSVASANGLISVSTTTTSATLTASTTPTFTGNVTAPNFIGNLNASLVTSGQFASGNYQFPSQLAVGTSSTNGYGIDVYGGLYSGSAGIVSYNSNGGGYGVTGNVSASGTAAIYGYVSGSSSYADGLLGLVTSANGYGVVGTNNSGIGVYGSGATDGVYGYTSGSGSIGVYGINNGGGGIGVYGYGGQYDFQGAGGEYTSGGSWVNASSRDLKTDFTPVNDQTILTQIDELPITKWVYKDDLGAWHIGPVAQDFYSIFGLGDNSTSISTIDPSGLALVGIQALDEKITTQQQEIDTLQTEVQQLTSAGSKNP